MAKKTSKPLGAYDPVVIDQVAVPVPNTGSTGGKTNKLSKSSKPVSGDRGGDHVLQAKPPEGAKVIQDHPKNYFGTGRNGYGDRKRGRA